MAERIQFSTIDQVTIIGDWVTAPTTLGAVILLHTMSTTRADWASFQADLMKLGLASLAIDLRGHGESIAAQQNGSKLTYKSFDDDQHQASVYDAIGALAWLKQRGFQPRNIVVCGGSFGANLALELLLEEPLLAGAALISPGRNYKGTDAVDDVGSVLPDQQLWITASEGDDQESFDAAQAVYEQAPSEEKTFVPLKHAGHGFAILASQPTIGPMLAAWLQETVQGG